MYRKGNFTTGCVRLTEWGHNFLFLLTGQELILRPSAPATRSTPQRAAAAESSQTVHTKAALKQVRVFIGYFPHFVILTRWMNFRNLIPVSSLKVNLFTSSSTTLLLYIRRKRLRMTGCWMKLMTDCRSSWQSSAPATPDSLLSWTSVTRGLGFFSYSKQQNYPVSVLNSWDMCASICPGMRFFRKLCQLTAERSAHCRRATKQWPPQFSGMSTTSIRWSTTWGRPMKNWHWNRWGRKRILGILF